MRLRLLLLSLVPAVAVGLFAVATRAETIRLGVTSGPHAQIAEALVPVARAQGLDVEVVEFSDGTIINSATQEGEIEANAFQHAPYLDQQNRDRQLDIVSAGRTVLIPMAAFSKKHKTLAELPDGAVVAIPNDPTNSGRALKLLEQGGLIKLKPGLGFNATELDITDNPKHLEIRQLQATQVPRSLDDTDLAVINSNYAILDGLDPIKDSLIRENNLSEYFCLIGVRRQDAGKPWVKTLVAAYRSPEVKSFVEKTFGGNIVAGW